MIHLRENPIGLDAVIAYAQVRLDSLTAIWGESLEVYPRCYSKVDADGKRLIEWFKKGVDYEAINVAEGNKLFFVLENDMVQTGNGYFTTTISLFGIINLREAKPEQLDRADAHIWSETTNALRQVPYFGLSERIVTGFQNVFGRYDYQQANDMQPYHCFRIEIPVLEFKLDQPEICII